MSVESYRSARVYEIPKDSTASVVEFVVRNDGAAVDISSATNLLFNTSDLDENAVDVDVACSFTTDGTDGKIDAPVSASTVGTVRDLVADVRYTIAGKVIVSYPCILRIIKGAK